MLIEMISYASIDSDSKCSALNSLPEDSFQVLDSEQSLQDFLQESKSQGVLGTFILSEKREPSLILRNLALSVQV